MYTKQWDGISEIKRFRVTIATNCWPLTCCMNARYTVGHERVYSLLFQFILCVLWVVIIFRYEYVKYSILYRGDYLRLIIYACYSWDMALHVGVGVSFEKCRTEIIREKAREVRKFIVYNRWREFPLNSEHVLVTITYDCYILPE
jgi:hypothetical protein